MADLRYKQVKHNHQEFLNKALKSKGFAYAYEVLNEDYMLVRELLNARYNVGLTQEAVADRMGTTKSAVSRMESNGKNTPSLTTLKKYAQAVGCRLEIKLVPEKTTAKRSTRTKKRMAV
jgi:DNA-binding XRE family transcriptional regulator